MNKGHNLLYGAAIKGNEGVPNGDNFMKRPEEGLAVRTKEAFSMGNWQESWPSLAGLFPWGGFGEWKGGARGRESPSVFGEDGPEGPQSCGGPKGRFGHDGVMEGVVRGP